MSRPIRLHALTQVLAASLLCATAPQAAADWRTDLGTFRIGMVAPDGAAEIAGVSKVKAAFSTALGMPVEIVVARDYAALIRAQAEKRLEYGVYSTLAYATARHLCGCVQAIAAPAALDGATGLSAALFSRNGSGATEEPKPDAPDASSHVPALLARTYYPGGDEAPAPSGEEGVIRFARGDARNLWGWLPASSDGPQLAGGTADLLAAHGLKASAWRIAWTSPLLRFGPHAVSADLDGQAIMLLQTLLQDLEETNREVYDLLEPLHAGGFRLVNDSDYESAHALLETMLGGAKPEQESTSSIGDDSDSGQTDASAEEVSPAPGATR